MLEFSLSEFADKINEVMPALFKEFARRQTNELFKGKITLPQFLVLALLHKEGESKMSDLAASLKVTTPAMTGISDRLVRYGYISRSNDLHDRRVIKIKLTAKGFDLVKKIDEQRRQMIINIFGKISQADRQEYLRILTKIKGIVTQENLG
jgi:MarR family transcriptional regulator, organic hydroperoxide resistance regulator